MITAHDAYRVSGLNETELLWRLSGAVLRTSTTHDVSRRGYRWCPVDVVKYAAQLGDVSEEEVIKAARDLSIVESVMLS